MNILRYNIRMQTILAFLPILSVIGLMILLRWKAAQAGLAGWLAGLLIAAAVFGLTPWVLLVSQLKGLYLSIYVLLVFWPALLLYQVVDQAGGIQAVARFLETAITDRPLLLLGLAWAFSGLLEGLAGFGLPVAIVSPMLVGLGVPPVLAVAAVSIGHSWSVTFGDMGVIFQTLAAVSKMDMTLLAAPAGWLLGFACLACGLATALLLGFGRRWPVVVVLAVLMAGVQLGLALAGLAPIASLCAGLVGILGCVLFSNLGSRLPGGRGQAPAAGAQKSGQAALSRPLAAAGILYGGLALLLVAIAVIPGLHNLLFSAAVRLPFPAVATSLGFQTDAVTQTFRPLLHPGTAIVLAFAAALLALPRAGLLSAEKARAALRSSWRAGVPASLSIIVMVGLSALMEHAGMTQLLAHSTAGLLGKFFPLASPMVGILGAFATGSNNNSNVLFAPLQQQVALLLALDPRWLLAAQTLGGSLGSMVAPAKIVVGCSTAGILNRQGEVLKRTLPYGIAIGILAGLLVSILALA